MSVIMELFKVIILGIVEGITEWLPISSTGHMLLIDELIQLNQSEEFKNMFFVVIQLGAIIAVVTNFWNKMWPFEKDQSGKNNLSMPIVANWIKVVVACIPAAIVGFLLDDWIDAHMHTPLVIAITLILYGVLFIVIENRNKGKKARVKRMEALSIKDAIIIGLFQTLALIPGTSRSGATIIGARVFGVSRKIATEFSFFLSVPIMFGASLLKLVKYGFHYSAFQALILVFGMVVAYFVSVYVIKFLMGYIKKHDFKAFGYYRIALGIVVIIFFGIKSIVS